MYLDLTFICTQYASVSNTFLEPIFVIQIFLEPKLFSIQNCLGPNILKIPLNSKKFETHIFLIWNHIFWDHKLKDNSSVALLSSTCFDTNVSLTVLEK